MVRERNVMHVKIVQVDGGMCLDIPPGSPLLEELSPEPQPSVAELISMQPFLQVQFNDRDNGSDTDQARCSLPTETQSTSRAL